MTTVRGSRTAPEVSRALTVMQHARKSQETFLTIFDLLRTGRRKTGGMTTDQEQDVLRAMLVFAAAGLDSALKHLIRDSLQRLAETDDAVQAELEIFVQRQLRGTADASDVSQGTKFLARMLAARQPRERLVEDYIQELTGASLQSPDQLFRTVKALGIEPSVIGHDARGLRAVFDVRNKIIHELDIYLDAPRRRRNTRPRDPLVQDAQDLLAIGDRIVAAVESKLVAA